MICQGKISYLEHNNKVFSHLKSTTWLDMQLPTC